VILTRVTNLKGLLPNQLLTLANPKSNMDPWDRIDPNLIPRVSRKFLGINLLNLHLISSCHGLSISGGAKRYTEKFKKRRGPKAPE
jgi:hypothetical protein